MASRRLVLRKTSGSNKDVDFRMAPKGDWNADQSGGHWMIRRAPGKGGRRVGCIKRPTFQEMLSIASVTKIYLLHILKPSTMPIFKCIWSHLGGPHRPWSSQDFLIPIIMVKTSKLSYRAHHMLIRKLSTKQRYFKCGKIVCYWYFQSYSRKRDNCHGHFVFRLYFSKYWK